jgi:hypothetical protein
MKKYLAMRLRRLANFLDPPPVGNFTVKIDCHAMQNALENALDKMKKEMLVSSRRRG